MNAAFHGSYSILSLPENTGKATPFNLNGVTFTGCEATYCGRLLLLNLLVPASKVLVVSLSANLTLSSFNPTIFLASSVHCLAWFDFQKASKVVSGSSRSEFTEIESSDPSTALCATRVLAASTTLCTCSLIFSSLFSRLSTTAFMSFSSISSPPPSPRAIASIKLVIIFLIISNS